MDTDQDVTCPRCATEGRQVKPQTLACLLEPDAARLLAGTVRFCSTANCQVAYYDASGAVVEARAVLVPIFQKQTNLDRPVCYCFGHTVAAVAEAQREDGSNPIIEAITAACRGGLDRCEQTNPQGRCCLGNVRLVARSPHPAPPCEGYP